MREVDELRARQEALEVVPGTSDDPRGAGFGAGLLLAGRARPVVGHREAAAVG